MLARYYILSVLISVVLAWPIKFVINFYLRRKRIMKLVKGLPLLEDYPIVGVGQRFIGKDNREIMQVIKQLISGKETPLVGYLGTRFMLLVDKPEDIQAVITAKGCIEKGDIYKFFNRSVGLFAAPAHIWKPQRKQLQTTFNLNIIQSFLPIFNSKARLLVRNISQKVGKGEFDLTKYTSPCTLDIVCETVMGSPMEIQDGKNTDYMQALANLLAVVARRMVNVFFHSDFIYKQSKLYEMECEYVARSEYLPSIMIKQKMKEFYETNNNADAQKENDDAERKYEKPQIFIDRLIRLYHKGMITEEEINDQVNLVIFGGNDTSSTTTSNAILLLAMHPEYEERAINEINGIFGESTDDCEITTDHINRLVYLEQVIKEALRLLPPGPFLLRRCTEETKLPNAIIPVGSEVVLSVYSAHRRKDVWGDDAEEFNPDHFSAEESAKRNPYAFMGFSQGPRNCLGFRFALMSVKVMLVKMLRKYKFSTNLKLDELELRWDVTSRLVSGPIVLVQERTYEK